MQVTIQWMEQQFHQFNQEYFDGGLPLPILKTGRSKTRLGQFACKRSFQPRAFLMRKKVKFYDFTITLSNYYDLSERQFQNVLLHEMIHYCITYTGLKDTSSHGIIFRGMADAWNKKGWNIRVTTSTKGVKVAKPSPNRECLVLAIEMTNGNRLLSVVNPKAASLLDRQASRIGVIRNYGWYKSSDDYFQSFPQVRSLKGRRVSLDEYEEKISLMQQVFI